MATTLSLPLHCPCARPCAHAPQAQPVQDWLRAACARAAAGDALDLPDGLTAADWACVREQAFPPSQENE